MEAFASVQEETFGAVGAGGGRKGNKGHSLQSGILNLAGRRLDVLHGAVSHKHTWQQLDVGGMEAGWIPAQLQTASLRDHKHKPL